MSFLGCCGGDEERSKNGMFTDYAWKSPEDDDDDDEDKGRHHNRHASQDRETQIALHDSRRAQKRAKIYASPIDLQQEFTFPNYPKTPEDRDFLNDALGDNFIFASLSPQERTHLIDAMQKESCPAETVIIRQYDLGDYFYIVDKGKVDFIANDVQVGSTSRGGSFGELALLYDCPRAATCFAATDCELWKVDQHTFRHLLAHHAKEEEQQVCQVLESIPLFEPLSTSCKSRLADALTVVKYKENERIVCKGDVGEVFYIIQSGTVKVHDIGMGDSNVVDCILSRGDFFGERALLTGEPRAANVTAVTDTTTLCLSRVTFEKVIGFLESIIERNMKKSYLMGIPLFAGSNTFTDLELNDIADVTREICFMKGQKICEIGKPYPQDLWIVQSGKILVLDNDGNIHSLLAGDYYGDKSIKADAGDLSHEDAITEEDTTCWVLSRKDLEDVIGDIDRLNDDYMPFRRSINHRSIRQKDLQLYRILGQGAFGKVWLVRNKQTDEPFAMKQLEKQDILRAKQVNCIIREKNIMNSLNHPFLLRMESSFQDEHRLYLVIQLVPGGELYSLVTGGDRPGLERHQARFYAACVLEAFGYMHVRNICYRDLKPENILIDAQGYAIVVDFGFAKIVVDKTHTLCGTPEYLAPEIIMSKGHDKAVDYWSFGVLVYEMLVGVTPFFEKNMHQSDLFKRIVLVKYRVSSDLNEDEKDLINKFLVRKQSARLGNLSRGHRDVKDHPWFAEFDFKKLVRKELEGPWIPKIRDPFDSSNFDDYRDSERDNVRHRKLSREEQDEFRDF